MIRYFHKSKYTCVLESHLRHSKLHLLFECFRLQVPRVWDLPRADTVVTVEATL